MKIIDGLELLVKFYRNHGQLSLVTDKSGVPESRLREWLDGCDEIEQLKAIIKQLKKDLWLSETVIRTMTKALEFSVELSEKKIK